MSFSVLGPLRARRGGAELDLGPPRQQAVLAVLLLRSPAVVSDDQIFEDVWGENAPASGVKVLRSYISRLRHSLGAGLLERISGGYWLRLDAEQLDLFHYHRLSTEARRCRLVGRLESSAAHWAAALELCRGEVLAGLPGAFAETNRNALAELRLLAAEQRWDVELELGNHVEIMPELHAARAESPLNERLTGMLMRSLSLCGRQAEALGTYFDTKRALADELGIDPSVELQQLYQRMLTTGPGAGR